MRYTAIVKDGGLFIPNIMPPIGTVQNIIEVDLTLPTNHKTPNQLSQSLINAVGILPKDTDGVAYQNAVRAEWD